MSNLSLGSVYCIEEHLSVEDVTFLRNLRRTFDCMMSTSETAGPTEGFIPMLNTRRCTDTVLEELTSAPCTRQRSYSVWGSAYMAYKVWVSYSFGGFAALKILSCARRKSDALIQEVTHLLKHMKRIGGEQTAAVLKVLEDTPLFISKLDDALEHVSDVGCAEVYSNLRGLQVNCELLLNALSLQNYAFHFRYLRDLHSVCLSALEGMETQTNSDAKLRLTFETIVPKLTSVIADLSGPSGELRNFSEHVLPSFAASEEERATTRQLALTTIATFFSSITATTLQFSYQQTSSMLSSAVNLFWFLSLVFSVSSGVNSLLALVWRKSSVYHNFRTPTYIGIWLSKAPIVFLAISALTFVVGLNLFPYSSHQMKYVALITNIFTALHVLGLMIVSSWFLVKSHWSRIGVQSIRRNLLWAFLREDDVFQVNEFIAAKTNWPENASSHPHRLARLLRHAITFCKYCLKRSSRSLISLSSWTSNILAPLSQAVQRTGSLILSVLRGVKKWTCLVRRRNRHLSRAGSSLLQGDLEAGNADGVDQNDDEECSSGQYAAVDKAVDEFIRLLDATFSGGLYQYYVKRHVDLWKNAAYTTDYLEKDAKLLLWGYPHFLQQLRDSVLPAMRAVDEVRGNST